MDKRVFSIVEFGRYRGWPARRGGAMRIRAASRNWPAAGSSQPAGCDETAGWKHHFYVRALSQAPKQLKNRDALSSLP